MRETYRTENAIAAAAMSGDMYAARNRYPGYGRDTLMRIAREAGALIRIGRRVMFNFRKMDVYLDSISGT